MLLRVPSAMRMRLSLHVRSRDESVPWIVVVRPGIARYRAALRSVCRLELGIERGQQAASAFLLWATAAKACGSELTRECVIEELTNTHEWTAGGFQAPADPGANTPTECGVLLKLEGTGFERVFPKEANTFDCDPSYAFKVTGAPVERAKIGSDRIAQL